MNPEQKKNHQGGSRLQKTEKKPREKRPGRPRTRRQKVLRGLYIALTVIAAVIVAGFIAWNLIPAPPDVDDPSATRKPQSTIMEEKDGYEIEVEIPGLSADRKKQFYTFLVVGQDTFGGGNTDTMMLAAYDVPNQRLSVMSLPRDTYVEYYGRKVLLNSVYNRAGGGDDGIAALKEEVGELTGVVPDFHVIIQWEAVGKLVDAIDGVWFDVPRRMYYNDLSQDFKIDLKEGDKVVSLVSLSLTPLKIGKIKAIHPEIDRVEVEAQAILFESGLYAKLPDDMSEELALAALDVAGAPAQTAKLVQAGDSVLILGGAGKGGMMCCYEAMKRVGPTGKVVALVICQADADLLKSMHLCHEAIVASATDPMDVLEKSLAANNGKEYDVSILIVNVPACEMSAILPVRDNGIVYFFSMATDFAKAALGAEGVGKDVTMIVGNGYTKGHAEITLAELRENPELKAYFEKKYL